MNETDAIRGRYERGVGWVAGRRALDQTVADVHHLLAHVDALAAEVARLRAAEVPLSANVGFVLAGTRFDSTVLLGEHPDEAYDLAADAQFDALEHDCTVCALIPVTAWDRT